jgi:HNH endonuclease
MSNHISAELRRLVVDRAEHLCEYCLIHEEDTFFGCEVDHIISIKHGGQSETNYLALAGVFCNRRKGTEIGSILRRTGEFIRFFNPRTDRWAEHFRLSRAVIEPLTGIGEVTARILDFNHGARILEREALIAVGRYPPEWLRTPLGK